MTILLRARHWQLFLMFVALPLAALFFFMPSGSFVMGPKAYRFLFPMASLFYAVGSLGWDYAIGTLLSPMVAKGSKVHPQMFRSAVISIMLYGAVVAAGLTILWSGQGMMQDVQSWVISLFMVFHFVAIGCTFYLLYNAAVVLRAFELKRSVSFADVFSTFLLLWFFPISVWSLQPVLNQVLQENAGPKPSNGIA